jgi:hypothetical protein
MSAFSKSGICLLRPNALQLLSLSGFEEGLPEAASPKPL